MSITDPSRENSFASFLLQSGPSQPIAPPLCSPRQDLSKEQHALLVQLCVVHPQAFLQAPHYGLDAYLKMTWQRRGSVLGGSFPACPGT